MTHPLDVTDLVLEKVGAQVFNGGRVHTRVRKGITGLPSSASGPSQTYRARPLTADEVRRKLERIARRAPQVMVRISGGGRGMRHIAAHLIYISRHGKIELEDQDGDRMVGAEEVDSVAGEWKYGGFPIGDVGERREAFNIILSMPAGTNELSVQRAAREFARETFPNHQYVMALHTFETDPDKDPSPNPHVHLCVKACDLEGRRLNPRKAQLQRWREGFAERLRDNGVDCDASRRLNRLQPQRAEKQSVRHMRLRGETPGAYDVGVTDPLRTQRARQAQKSIMEGYRELIDVLAGSANPADRQLSLRLGTRMGIPDRAPIPMVERSVDYRGDNER